MVFLNSQGPIPGMSFGFPDTCLTPMVPAPVPIPYPNFAMRPVSIPTVLNVFTMMMPNHNLLTTQPVTMGDNTGVNLGVATGMVMGPSRNYTSSVKVIQGASQVTRMLDMTGHNGMSPNIPGISISPTQIVVMVLS